MNIPDPQLCSWLQHNYPISETPQIDLLRAYTNQVFRIVSGDDRYVLKIYKPSWRSKDQIKYEIELLLHLDQGGLSVAKPIQGNHQEFVKPVPTGQGEQFAVLYEFAAGEKPEPPFSNQLYILFGEAIGRMHAISKDFSTGYPRESINLELLIDRPLEMVMPFLANRKQESAMILSLANKVKNRIHQLSTAGLDWGPIHGDATLDNLHVVEDKHVVLYDFDSGGPGWRASDLQGWAIGYPEYQERYASFLTGYRQVREIRDQEIEASWYLTLAWDLWGMQVDLENRILKNGQGAADQYLTEQIDWIRNRAKFLK